MTDMDSMPALPKKAIQKEGDFGTRVFRPWVHANISLFDKSCTFELKQTEKDYISFSCVEDAQCDASLAARWSDRGYLIRNQSGTIGAPDYSLMVRAPAFIVVKYPEGFVLIDIDTWMLEKGRSKKKSLSWERAREISWLEVTGTSRKIRS